MNLITAESIRMASNGIAAVGMEMYIMAFVLILLLVGGKKIPELMRGVGKGVGELQKGLEEGKKGLNTTHSEPEPPTPTITAQTPPETQARNDGPKSPTA